MSIKSVPYLVKNGWGLEEEDLNRIIRIEKLEDVSHKFSDQIKTITEKFGSLSRLRILAFDKESGIDSDSKKMFMSLILAERDVFYHAGFSNKECCVVLIFKSKGELVLKSFKHILSHEYAHHIQFSHECFPYYIYKRSPRLWVPPFVACYEVGPEIGSVSIDGLPLPDLHTIVQDSNERISDIICEGLLRQKDLVADFLEYFQHDIALREDPASLPQYTSHPNIKRYIRRLALRDNAEWGATIQLAYPKNSNVCKVISQGKKLAVRLNKKYPKASQVHNEIFNLCINTDFHSFKNPEKAVSYTKKVMDLLNMKIKTKEKW